MVTFQLPSGPKNLQPLFPAVDFSQVEEYYLQLQNQSDEAIVATTNRFKRGCCCNGDTVRLFFVNYLGGIDAVNFTIKSGETDVKSTQWKKALKYPLQKWDGGTQRLNVVSNEILKVENSCYAEEDQEWLMELIATPNAWIQWTGTQGQNDNYIPVVISDGKFITRKEIERYNYVLEIDIQFSNDNIILRN